MINNKLNYSVFIVALILLTSFSFCQSIDPDYQKMIEDKYDGFPLIGQDEAESKLQKKNVIFIDVREPNEFTVSHIPKAIPLGYNEINWSALDSISTDNEIIVYCSIGLRSQEIGKKLNDMGYANVKNLYGGLFLWSEQERILVDESANTTISIHGYNKFWGKWIKHTNVVYD